MGQLRLVAPEFVRIQLHLTPEGCDLEVWEADDDRYLSRAAHAVLYPSCSVGEALDIIASTLDCLGLPDPF